MTDAELGAMVRKQAKEWSDKITKPEDTQVFFTVALALVSFARRMGGDINLKVPDVTDSKTGKKVGSYKITVEEI